MRPIWSGYISFGLVNIPVNLYSAEKRLDLRFHLLDSRDKSRIHYKRINEETGDEVPWDKIVHGYELNKDNYIIIKDADFNKIHSPSKTIAVEHFVCKEEIDHVYFETPYYLTPDKGGIKSYVLFREALREEKKIGIAKVTIRGREHLAAITLFNTILVLNLLRFKQELCSLTEFELPMGTIKDYQITAKEVTLAKQLINSMYETWEPEKYHDEYREKIMLWIGKSKAKEKLPEKKLPSKKIEHRDLVELMKKSMAQILQKTHSVKRKG